MFCTDSIVHGGDTSRRILVVNSGGLLDDCLTSLLSSQTGFDVSTVAPLDEAELTRDVVQSHPDVVVLTETWSAIPLRLMKTFEGIPDLAGLKMIVAHVNDDALDVYMGRRASLADGAALFALARGECCQID